MMMEEIKEEFLDEGSYGTVYQINDDTVKKKCILIENATEKSNRFDAETVIRELNYYKILEKYNSSYGQLFKTSIKTNSRFDVNLYMPNYPMVLAALFKHGLPSFVLKHVFLQIINELLTIQQIFICHGDLKPENIVVTNELEVKVIDFGAGVFEVHRDKQICKGTTTYMGPEMFEYKENKKEKKRKPFVDLKPETDLWSLGIIIYEGLFGIMDEDESPNQENIDTSEYKEIINGLLQNNPEDRLTLKDAYDLIYAIKEMDCDENYNIKRKRKIMGPKPIYPILKIPEQKRNISQEEEFIDRLLKECEQTTDFAQEIQSFIIPLATSIYFRYDDKKNELMCRACYSTALFLLIDTPIRMFCSENTLMVLFKKICKKLDFDLYRKMI